MVPELFLLRGCERMAPVGGGEEVEVSWSGAEEGAAGFMMAWSSLAAKKNRLQFVHPASTR